MRYQPFDGRDRKSSLGMREQRAASRARTSMPTTTSVSGFVSQLACGAETRTASPAGVSHAAPSGSRSTYALLEHTQILPR